MKWKILVVDDDKKTVDLIRLSLEKEHFEALVAYEGIEALALTRSESPDLIILDWMVPNVGGLDLCRIVRSESTIPVIMLTAKATEEDKLLGLNLGVDDYLTKPFSLRELVARVRVVLRRTYPSEEHPATLHFRDLMIDLCLILMFMLVVMVAVGTVAVIALQATTNDLQIYNQAKNDQQITLTLLNAYHGEDGLAGEEVSVWMYEGMLKIE